MVAEENKSFYGFGPFRLYTPDLLLVCGSRHVHLTPKALEVLLVLVRNQGGMMTKEELFQAVWPDTFIDESILAHNIYQVRKALARNGASPDYYIETISKRGYRFAPDVEFHNADARVRSLAVLPFREVGIPPGGEYLGFGLADAVATRLAGIGELAVRPSSTVSKYEGDNYDSVKAGAELAVSNVLEGVLRRVNGSMRVTIQLVDVAARNSVWATKLDVSSTDLLRLEDSVTEAVAAALPVQLKGREWERLRRRHTDDIEAYHLHLRARSLLFRVPGPGTLRDSMDLLQEALRRDKRFARCYSDLAYCYQFLAMYGEARPREVIPQAKSAAQKALRLDDGLVDAHAALAFARWHYDYQWAEAEAVFRRLTDTVPNDSRLHTQLAMLVGETGRFPESLRELDRALALEPNFAHVHANKAVILCLARRFEEAIPACRAALRLDPGHFRALWIMGVIQAQRGKHATAIQHLRRAAELSGNHPSALASLVQSYAASGATKQALAALAQLHETARSSYLSASEMAVAYAGLGDLDRAFEALFTALEEHAVSLVLAKNDPQLDPLRSDARFADVLRRIGLAAPETTERAAMDN